MNNLSCKISNFENSTVITNVGVFNFVSSLFPEKHIRPITEIRYVDRYYSLVSNHSLDRLLITGSNVTSQWSIDQKTGQETIEIFRQNPEGNTDVIRMKSDIAHEIGHSVFNHLPEDKRVDYEAIWSTNKKQRPDIRAANYVAEDFCYAYAMFFLEREKLLSNSHQKFDFIKGLI